MTTFGGFSANGNISAFLQSQESAFVEMVVSYSALLRGFTNQSEEVVRVAQRQVYPRIGLILASAKTLDNSYLFAASSTPDRLGSVDYLTGVYETVVEVMTASASPFSEGITGIAAMMTAATLIRQIPINNDIKNLDLALELEKIATTDLNRIIELYKESTKAKVTTATPSVAAEEDLPVGTLYLSLGIDKTTLPSSYFDQTPVQDVINLREAFPSAQIRTLSQLTIPPEKVAFGWCSISTTELDNGSNLLPTITPSVEQCFFIKEGDTAEDLIELIADEVNSVGLSAQSNILCSPNQGELEVKSVSLIKKSLYDQDASTFASKIAKFDLLQRIHSLTFDVRRISSLVFRELIVVRFFSADKVTLAQKLNPTLSTFSYRGTWVNTTSYVVGDVIDFGTQSAYVCLAAHTGITPGTNVVYWKKIYSSSEDLISLRTYCDGKIEGLVYGTRPLYEDLSSSGPKSLILNVERGTLKFLTGSSGGGTATAAKAEVDTFYFKGIPTAGRLRIRVSSTDFNRLEDVSDQTAALVPTLLDSEGCLVVPITGVTSSEDLALATLKALYRVSQATDVLGALVYPNALQMICFKKTRSEVKAIIDLIELPEGIEVATGSSTREETLYKTKPRSLIVTATSLKERATTTGSSGGSGGTTTSELPNNKDYGVAQATRPERSVRLQSVYDRIQSLNL